MDLEHRAGASPLARTEQLHTWDEERLRRYAVQAAAERDVERLWLLCEAYMTLHGKAGVATSKHTYRAYRRGVVELVALWQGESILRPSRDAGTMYVQRLRAGDRETPDAPAGPPRRGRRPTRGPLAPATVELRVAAARMLYAALRWAGATERDPFRDVGSLRGPTREEDVMGSKVYTEFELVEILAHAADPQERVIVLLGAHGGLRVSEMLALRWDEIDLEAKRLLVRGGKGGKDGLVGLTPKLAEALRGAEREMLVGVRRPTVLLLRSQFGVYRRLRRLCDRAGVRFRGVHGLRHAAGTGLYHQTGDLGQVQDHLRHATLDMARRYARSDRRALERSLETWE
jgi:integrase/recombinase XerC